MEETAKRRSPTKVWHTQQKVTVCLNPPRETDEERSSTRLRANLTRVGAGTPPYIAPEQFVRKDIDLRADIYAVGCILVEMATEKLAVQAGTWESCQELHQRGEALKFAATISDILRPFAAKYLAGPRCALVLLG